MSEENKPKQDSEQQGIFEDLLRDAPISSLNIEEPEFNSFDINSVISQAQAETENNRKNSRIFGKRTRRAAAPETEETAAPAAEEPKPSASQILRESAPISKEPSLTYSQIVESEKREDGSKPKTFRELLNSNLLDSKEEEPVIETSPIIETPAFEEVELDENAPVVGPKTEEPAAPAETTPAKEAKEEPEEKEEEEEDEIIDPSASLVDDYHYDEYEDKKRFLLSDYKKMEEYLASQSEQGYHFVRHEGKKYYFIKGKPHHYYYKVLYFSKEPSPEQFERWAEDGWKQVDQAPSRHKRDAGWYVLRNEKESEDSLPKDIENEEEKYRYFSKFSSSCRSTMFLLFIVMFCAAISIWLQIQFKGFQEVIWASAILLVIALYVFLMYARMLAKSRKQASLLSARIRLADHDPDYQALRHAHETDAQLDADWNSIQKKTEEDEKEEDSDEE